MKKILQILSVIVTAILVNAQTSTAGTLAFSFTQPEPLNLHEPGVPQNILAIWIEDAAGNLVTTRGDWYGPDTGDHLPAWSAKAGCTLDVTTLSGCNVNSDALSGATLDETTSPQSFGTQSFTWNGKNSSGNTVLDGDYIIFIESAWEGANDGEHDALYEIPFTKSVSTTYSNPASDANFNNANATWTPSSLGVSNSFDVEKELVVYPNPVKNNFSIKTSNIIKNVAIYDATGKKVKSFENISIYDISNLKNGIYIIEIKTGERTFYQKIIKN